MIHRATAAQAVIVESTNSRRNSLAVRGMR